jgi:hypothetical protein
VWGAWGVWGLWGVWVAWRCGRCGGVGSLLTFDIPQTALVATLDTYDLICIAIVSLPKYAEKSTKKFMLQIVGVGRELLFQCLRPSASLRAAGNMTLKKVLARPLERNHPPYHQMVHRQF